MPGAGEPGQPEPQAHPRGERRTDPPARLKRRPDFLRAGGGGRVHSRSFSLQVFRRGVDDAVDHGRVGLTVTKKVGGAVERNRIKRRLREALRTPGLPVQPDHDYVVVARREALSVSFSGLVGEMRRCLGEAASGRARKPGPRRKPGSGPKPGGATAPRS